MYLSSSHRPLSIPGIFQEQHEPNQKKIYTPVIPPRMVTWAGDVRLGRAELEEIYGVKSGTFDRAMRDGRIPEPEFVQHTYRGVRRYWKLSTIRKAVKELVAAKAPS